MSETDVREVSFEEALAEEKDGSDPQPDSTPAPDPGPVDQSDDAPAARPRPGQAQEEVHTPESDLELLAPKTGAKEWTFGTPDSIQKVYVQRELSVIGKTQWFSLVGEILDKSLSGDSRLSLNSLLTPPERSPGEPLRPTDFRDADTFVHAVGKLMEHSPQFLSQSVCIWLAVPDYEWDLVDDLMKRSPQAGGLSDDQFEEIFAIFLDQNLPSIMRFFQERFPRLRGRFQARRKEIEESRSRSQKR